MPTPAMLRPPAMPPRPDPLVSVNIAVAALIAAALFVAGILAVYSWATPDLEAPLVLVISIAFVGTLIFDVAFLCARHLRSPGGKSG